MMLIQVADDLRPARPQVPVRMYCEGGAPMFLRKRRASTGQRCRRGADVRPGINVKGSNQAARAVFEIQATSNPCLCGCFRENFVDIALPESKIL